VGTARRWGIPAGRRVTHCVNRGTMALWSLDRRKYGLEFTVVTFIERVLARGQKPRLILLIALTA
jgi:hypothetical protein